MFSMIGLSNRSVYHISFSILVTVFILVELSIFGSNLCEKHLHNLYMLDITEVRTLLCINRPIQYGYIFLFVYVFDLMKLKDFCLCCVELLPVSSLKKRYFPGIYVVI